VYPDKQIDYSLAKAVVSAKWHFGKEWLSEKSSLEKNFKVRQF
jgi:hypothetical protein